jgi:hypothetical protein
MAEDQKEIDLNRLGCEFETNALVTHLKARQRKHPPSQAGKEKTQATISQFGS